MAREVQDHHLEVEQMIGNHGEPWGNGGCSWDFMVVFHWIFWCFFMGFDSGLMDFMVVLHGSLRLFFTGFYGGLMGLDGIYPLVN